MLSDLDECHKILGLEPGASPDEVKQAYRDLAKVWHPDRFQNDARLQQKAQERFKEINQAYERLRHLRPTSNSKKPHDPHESSEARTSGAARKRSSKNSESQTNRASNSTPAEETGKASAPKAPNSTPFSTPIPAGQSSIPRFLAIIFLVCLGIIVFVYVRKTSTTTSPKEQLTTATRDKDGETKAEAPLNYKVTDDSTPPVPYINLQHWAVLKRWLSSKSSFRLATEKDWKDSGLGLEGQLEYAKDVWGKDWHPYYAVGDFNRDGKEDFAVALISLRRSKPQLAVAVFNAPLDINNEPVFFDESFLITDWLYFRTGDDLLVGPFESEGGMLQPRGKGYRIKYAEF